MSDKRRPKPFAPRLSNIVAAELRQRILNGDLEDGSHLPKLEDLVNEFNVSLPTIREALRILETEGLVTVLRGKKGGCVVHTPNRQKAAYTIASVLQAKRVALSDVSVTIQLLVPLCCELAARRSDRKKFISHLKTCAQLQAASIDDPERFRATSAIFHRELVNACDNETLILIVGTLEALWLAHARSRAQSGQWAVRVNQKDRVRYAMDADDIVTAIAGGDAPLARKLAADHLQLSTRHTLADDDVGISASFLAATSPHVQ